MIQVLIQMGLFILDPMLSFRFESAQLKKKGIQIRIRDRLMPKGRDPIHKLLIIKPRSIKLKWVIVGGTMFVPFQDNRIVVRDIGAVGPNTMDPNTGDQGTRDQKAV